MTQLLHRLGEFAYRRPWMLIISWVIALGVVGGAAAVFMKPPSEALSIPGTEAQVAIDRAAELFPDSGKGSGQIVFRAEDGTSISDHQSEISSLLRTVEATDGVTAAVSPFASEETFISQDKKTAIATVQFKEGAGEIPTETLEALQRDIDKSRTTTLSIESSGGFIAQGPGDILGIGEVIGVVVALVVLVATLGSLIAAGMPIVLAVVAVGVSTAGLFSLSQLIDITTTTPVLGIMLGLAVGIDYSLFIINKYRTLLRHGYANRAAAGKALATAGNAVVFAAATVIIALSALSVIGIPFMTTMGLAGAASIAVAALAVLTLLPALLGLCGNRIFSRRDRTAVQAAQKRGPNDTEVVHKKQLGYRWVSLVVRHPWMSLLASVVVIAAIAFPVTSLKLGLPSDAYAASDTTQRKAYNYIAEGFGAGYNGQLVVVAEHLPAPTADDRAAVTARVEAEYQRQYQAAKSAQEAAFRQKVAAAQTPEQQQAVAEESASAQAAAVRQEAAARQQVQRTIEYYTQYAQLSRLADAIAKTDGVAKALPAAVTKDGTAGIVQIIPVAAPTSDETAALITTLRESSTQQRLTDANGTTLAITGTTAMEADINSKLAAALPEYLIVVVGLSLVLLVIAFRSLFVPLKATLGFLLSVAAMFGSIVAVYQWGWFGLADAPGPIVSFVPILVIGVLFGLAMDYEFFLVSSIKEAYERGTSSPKQAIVRGFSLASRVVTAAAIIMIAVFAGFIFNHSDIVQPIGFGLAIGVLIDAFLVRMTIVPAALALVGKGAWWLPKWLDRITPHVSIEGETEPAKK